MSEKGVALTIADSPFMPVAENMTADFVYVRWEGDRKKVRGTLGQVEVDRSEDIKMWAGKVTSFLDDGMEVFGYFSKYYSGHPPTDANRLLKPIQLAIRPWRISFANHLTLFLKYFLTYVFEIQASLHGNWF